MAGRRHSRGTLLALVGACDRRLYRFNRAESPRLFPRPLRLSYLQWEDPKSQKKMIRPFTVIRQLLFPQGLVALIGLFAISTLGPISMRPESLRGLVLAFLAVDALLAARLHSLRSFLVVVSLTTFLIFTTFSVGHIGAQSFAAVVTALTLVLLLLVEDSFFDWQAVAWWTGLQAMLGVALLGLARAEPEFIARIASAQVQLPMGNIYVLEGWVALAGIALLARFLYSPDAVSSGTFWALVAFAPALRHPAMVDAYIALAGLTIGLAVIERSHWIAYHDELTGLPGRRAFNEALAALGDEYCIAVVDVDHFKSFNDTYGHDTGDQVLRKVAMRLAAVEGGGKAFRCGGEEFAILFPDGDMNESRISSEEVRCAIEEDIFIVRGPSRSQRERPERRETEARKKQPRAVETAVTVSMGLAPSELSEDVQEVIRAADKALYRAKSNGRNRLEMATLETKRKRRSSAVLKKTTAHTNQ